MQNKIMLLRSNYDKKKKERKKIIRYFDSSLQLN